MNEWMKQRDLLIEKTLAFVQGVAINASRIPSLQPEGDAKEPATPVQMSVVAKDPAANEKVETERALIHSRLMNFKAHQQRFQREREEYFAMTIAKARANQSGPKP
jgi:hypothetical protein